MVEAFCEEVYSASTSSATTTPLADEEESRYMSDLASGWGFRRVETHANFRSRRGTMWPPTGYAASIPAKTPFVADPFLNAGLFGGVWMFRVRAPPWTAVSVTIPDATKADIARNAAARIRDVSPNPPAPTDDPEGGWVEALGSGDSVGLYCGPDADSGEDQWAVRVQSALPTETLEAFELELQGLERSKCTVATATADAFGRMERLAEFNARRLACAFAECAGVAFEGGDAVACAAAYDVVAGGDTAPASIDAALRWVGASAKIPSWCVLPPRGEGLGTELRGYRLGEALAALAPDDARRECLVVRASHAAPDVATMWGVVRADDASGNVVFYNACAPHAEGVAVCGDPLKPARILTWRRGGSRAAPHTLAVGNVARVEAGAGVPPRATHTPAIAARHFWLDAAVANVNVAATYGDVDVGSSPAPATSRFMTPHWTRHSMFGPGPGPGGRVALAEDALERLRCVLLMRAETYVPLG